MPEVSYSLEASSLSYSLEGQTDAEDPIYYPTDANSRLIGKTLMLGKIEGGRRRGHRG